VILRKSAKKNFSLFHRNVKITKENFFITVLSFFYGHRASDFQFNVPEFDPGLVIGIFLKDFIISETLAQSVPLSGVSLTWCRHFANLP
jgi:hypothetical protein